jgi:hypothetical protein
MKENKMFKELEFKPHFTTGCGERAYIEFPNGYAASIVKGAMYYTSEEKPYELAVMKDGCVNYNTWLTNDVLGYLDEDDVEHYLKAIKEL